VALVNSQVKIDMKPNSQLCVVCRDHKGGTPFLLRDDHGVLSEFSHISNCQYCGRFLVENYNISIQLSLFPIGDRSEEK